MWWLPLFCVCVCVWAWFFSNRNEDRKTALLNLLSVKGLLGIFSMWRKIRKSLWNFCQAAEVSDSSHTPLGLVNSYQRFRGGSSGLSISQKEVTRAQEKKTNIGKHKASIKCQGFCLWPSKGLRLVWKWLWKPASVCSVGARDRSVYFCVHFAEVGGWDPEVKGNMLGQIWKPLDPPQFCL